MGDLATCKKDGKTDIGKLHALTQSHLNLKDWNLQGGRTSVMYCILVTVYLLHLLHLPMTSAVGEVAHVSQIDPRYYEEYCQHIFTHNCPVYSQYSRDCAKMLTKCTSPDYPYHCITNAEGNVFHVCAAAQMCQKGSSPIYDPSKHAVICQTCPAGYYQDNVIWSNETPVCKPKFECDIREHKIECPVESKLQNTQDTLCRCDARNGYVYSHPERTAECFIGNSARCVESGCEVGQEMLRNYTCAPRCKEGFQRDDSDICVPESTIVPMASGVTEKASPTSTASSENSSIRNSSADIDTKETPLIAITVSIAVILIIVVLVCLKWKLYKKCQTAINTLRSTRRQSSQDQTDESEMRHLNEATVEGPQQATVEGPQQVPTVVPKQETTNDVLTVVPEHVSTNDENSRNVYYINATNVIVGAHSNILSHGAPPIQQQTADDSPLRHSNPQQAASIPPLTSI